MSDIGRRQSITNLHDSHPVSTSTRLFIPDTDNDLFYTVNALNSFSFGGATSAASHPPTRSINPLSTEEDSVSFDVTPRPSVADNTYDAGYGQHTTRPPAGSHRSQNYRNNYPDPHFDAGSPPPRSTSRASHHTFGGSSSSVSASASESVASFSSSSMSRTVDSSQSTRYTSATSTDSEDHQHPVGFYNETESEDYQFSSSDGDDLFEDEYYDEDDEEDRIEISSARFDRSSSEAWYPPAWNVGAGPGSIGGDRDSISRGSFASGFGTLLSERRGSVPIAIPGATHHDPYAGRDREDSMATITAAGRRPSRSLDNEPRDDVFRQRFHQNDAVGSGTASVPESDGDWKSIQSRRMRSATVGVGGTPTATARQAAYPNLANAPPQHRPSMDTTGANSVMDGFDSDWVGMAAGITSFDNNDFAQEPRSAGPWYSPNRGSRDGSFFAGGTPRPPPNGRRPSAISIMFSTMAGRNDERRPSYASSILNTKDTFERAVYGKWDGRGYGVERSEWTFKREKADGMGPLPGSSLSLGERDNQAMARRKSTGGAIGLPGGVVSSMGRLLVGKGQAVIAETDRVGLGSNSSGRSGRSGKSTVKELDTRDREREIRAPENWKGMPVWSGEVWCNQLVGRYHVNRKSILPSDGSNKGPQQRLIITHFRDATTKLEHKSPPVTVHKHSKAAAFSISRFYRPIKPPPPGPGRSGASAFSDERRKALERMLMESQLTLPSSKQSTKPGKYPRPPASRDGTVITNITAPTAITGYSTMTARRGAPAATPPKSSMFLLAPLKVQKAFTSTNTTRKLESHGHLDDTRRKIDALTQMGGSEVKDKSSRKDKDRDRDAKGRRQKDKDRREKDLQASSGGSVVSTSSYTPFASQAQAAPTGPIEPHSILTDINREAPLPPLPTSPIDDFPSPRRRNSVDYDLNNSDEEELPRRTPHSETYSTVDASTLERFQRAQQIIPDADGSRLRRILGRPSAPTMSAPVPWMLLPSRGRQEKQQQAVDNLNTSFQDVGLLPSTSRNKSKQKEKEKAKAKASRKSGAKGSKPERPSTAEKEPFNALDKIAPEALFMILPLWPGDTDRESRKVKYERPDVPPESRQFLLVYYKPREDPTPEKPSRGSKDKAKARSNELKKSGGTSSSSGDKQDHTNILLSSFDIVGRLLHWSQLQGSNIRIPDEGICVNGSLAEAYATMPKPGVAEEITDWIIATCESREAGILFNREGLESCGLCRRVDTRVTVADRNVILGGGNYGGSDKDFPEPLSEPTAIGRAIMEMVWIGAMALNSFGSITS